MPWKVSTVVKERERFIDEWISFKTSRGQLCREFGISRKTGYKMWRRFCSGGFEALENKERRAKHYPNRTQPEIEQRIVEERKRHQSWGPKKLLYVLKNEGVESPPA